MEEREREFGAAHAIDVLLAEGLVQSFRGAGIPLLTRLEHHSWIERD